MEIGEVTCFAIHSESSIELSFLECDFLRFVLRTGKIF